MLRCIIIGNGPSAIEKENGDIVDSFDKVVRINNFVTNGFEKFVGTKTDIIFTCEFPEFYFPEVIVSLINVSTQDYRLYEPNIIDNIGWDLAKKIGVEAGIEWPCYPSTGLIAIYYFLYIKGYHVTIMGFDNFKDGRSAHYSELDRQNFPSRHDGEKEKLYIEKLNISRI